MSWRDMIGLAHWSLDQAQAALWDLERILEVFWS